MKKRHNPEIDLNDWKTHLKDLFSYDPSIEIVDIYLDIAEGKYHTKTEHNDGKIIEDEYLTLIIPALNIHNNEMQKFGKLEKAVLFRDARGEINLNVYLYERLSVNSTPKFYTL
ncbi:hypothetical protein HY837_00255 [archaeon]|nr:hypothetical protein [archaeon]